MRRRIVVEVVRWVLFLPAAASCVALSVVCTGAYVIDVEQDVFAGVSVFLIRFMGHAATGTLWVHAAAATAPRAKKLVAAVMGSVGMLAAIVGICLSVRLRVWSAVIYFTAMGMAATATAMVWLTSAKPPTLQADGSVG